MGYKTDNQNTKQLINSLLNPVISGLIPQTANMIDYFVDFAKKDTQSHFYCGFDFNVYLPSVGENLQRENVWQIEDQIKLIENIFIRGYYIPNIVVNIVYDKNGKKLFKVIDGKQRLTAISDFINGKFAVGGFYFQDVELGFLSHVTRIVFECYYDELSDEQLVALFEKTNFFGVPQDKARFEKIKAKVTK